MDAELSLLEDLRGSGFEASVITTYNAYLPFYEEVVLRRLVAAGCRHNVVLIDHRQFAQALLDSSYLPSSAGSQYTLLPIRAPGAFHPKITFLAGGKKAVALVGSHNLTISGFGYNRELTNRIEAVKGGDADAIQTLGAVWGAIAAWSRSQEGAVPQEVVDAALSVANAAQWIREERNTQTRFLASAPGWPSLWVQLRPFIDFNVRRVAVVGPFFDENFSLVAAIDEELQPKRFCLAVEPDTVALGDPRQLPEGIRIVNADALGARTGYLHAKALYIEGSEEEAVLATGSANPGFSAWLAPGMDRNAEAIVVKTGKAARAIANHLGLNAVFDFPKLTNDELGGIAAKRKARVEPEGIDVPIALAVEAKDGFLVRSPNVEDPVTEATLLGSGRLTLGASKSIKRQGESLFIGVSDAAVRKAAVELRLARKNKPDILVLVHHAEEIADRARTGRQAQFRAALATLSSATPDLARLITLVGDIIFDTEAEVGTTTSHSGKRARPDDELKPMSRPGSLAVSIGDIRRRAAMHRLVQSGDFGYLIDVLIHRLGAGLEMRSEDVDRMGRSEEEQRKQDDESPSAVDTLSDKDVAATCRRKVRTLATRMTGQLELAATGKAPAERALVQLLAVLATVRELRIHEQQHRWRLIGESLINEEDRGSLLAASLAYLYGRRYTLMKKTLAAAAVDDQPDEVQRLPGLLLWLAWDCGLQVEERAVYGEDPEVVRERAEHKAILLAVSPPTATNDIARQEAEASILKTARPRQVAIAKEWLARHLRWGERLSEHTSREPKLRHNLPQAGDLVYLTADKSREPYVVSTVTSGFVQLVDLSDLDADWRFLPDRVVPLH